MDVTSRTESGHAFKTLLHKLQPYRWRIAMSIALPVTGAIAASLTASMFGEAIDQRAQIGLRPMLAWFAAIAVAIAGSAAGTEITGSIARDLYDTIALELFDRLSRRPAYYSDRLGVSRVATLIPADLARVAEALQRTFPATVTPAILALGGLVAIARIHSGWLPLSLVATLAMGLGGLWLTRTIAAGFIRLRKATFRINEVSGEIFDQDLARVAFIETNAIAPHFTARFTAAITAHTGATRRMQRAISSWSQFMSIGPAFAFPIAWAVSAGASIGDRVAFATTLSAVLMSITRAVDNVIHATSAWPNLRGVLEILAEPVAERSVDVALTAADLTDKPIVFDRAQCTLGGIKVLDGFSLELLPGSDTVVVGANGAGKSTALLLLTWMRVADESTAVCIGDTSVPTVPRDLLAKVIGYLPPNPPKFPGSAHDNLVLVARVLLGRDPTADEVTRARNSAGITFPLDGAASDLSTGSWVRVALAQLLLAGRTVVIVDETLKHIDPIGRRELRTSLRRIGVTLIEVSHEVPANFGPDTLIAVIADGTVVEKGTHAELMRRGTYYRAAVMAASASPDEGAQHDDAQPAATVVRASALDEMHAASAAGYEAWQAWRRRPSNVPRLPWQDPEEERDPVVAAVIGGRPPLPPKQRT